MLFPLLLLALVCTSLTQMCGKPKSPDIMNLARENGFLTTTTRRVPSTRTTRRGIVTTLKKKIVSGFDVTDRTGGQFCWQVLINIERGLQCGGTIIGPRTILTAAHCIIDETTGETYAPEEVMVMVGALNSHYTGGSNVNGATGCAEAIRVTSVDPYPGFVYSPADNDIAVLTLSKSLNFAKHCVCPLCLSSESPTHGNRCVVSGYGDERHGGGVRAVVPLKWTYLVIANQGSRQCAPRPRYPTHFLCGWGGAYLNSTCQGDSGGPLACFNPRTSSYYLAGLVSHGGEFCDIGLGTQFTKVSLYLPWIAETSVDDIEYFG